jgi:hypothetical protein
MADMETWLEEIRSPVFKATHGANRHISAKNWRTWQLIDEELSQYEAELFEVIRCLTRPAPEERQTIFEYAESLLETEGEDDDDMTDEEITGMTPEEVKEELANLGVRRC